MIAQVLLLRTHPKQQVESGPVHVAKLLKLCAVNRVSNRFDGLVDVLLVLGHFVQAASRVEQDLTECGCPSVQIKSRNEAHASYRHK